MGESVCFCDSRLAPELPPGITCRSLRETETPGPWELCALAPGEAEQMAGRTLRCRTLLVPEGMYQPAWQADQVVSYGLSGRSSLTLSSMDGQGVLCVQRALQDRLGQIREEQELPLPARWGKYPPAERLLLAGTWLLWGKELC